MWVLHDPRHFMPGYQTLQNSVQIMTAFLHVDHTIHRDVLSSTSNNTNKTAKW